PWNKIYHKPCASLGVEEFLGYFKNAQFVITNGFHGACFSILFKKNFYLFARDGIDLKQKSLVSTLGLEQCFVERDDKRDLTEIAIDYDAVYKKLNEERKKSQDFINMAIVNSTK
ncbi:MAG: polysaccharide pyruvyl transferase family protein, partial [Bacteroidales bacterium]|nr:polysaccharide pyruvyl transferase family protein [Bacteroidales bacterium]